MITYSQRHHNKFEYSGLSTDKIFTKSGTLVSGGFERIEHGDRGDFVEFSKNQIIFEDLIVPDWAKWRLDSKKPYYLEYRTKDNVKVYYQLKVVWYANYKLGRYYISPKYLKGFIVCSCL